MRTCEKLINYSLGIIKDVVIFMKLSRRVIFGLSLIVIILAGGGAAYYYWGILGVQTPAPQVYKIALLSNTYEYTTYGSAVAIGLEEAVRTMNSSERPLTLKRLYGIPIADIPRVAEELINDGYRLFIVPHVVLEATTVALADAHPDILFLGSGGWSNSSLRKNLAIFAFDIYKGYYLAGIVAGAMTKTNTIGFTTAFKYASAAQIYNMLMAGATRVNPNVKGLYTFTGSYGDSSKGAASADALMDAGADLVVGLGNGMTDGAIKEADRRGVYSMGCYWDEHMLAPNTVITSVMYRHEYYYVTALRAVFDGTFANAYWSFGIKEGVVDIAPFHQLQNVVPQSTQDLIQQVKQGIISGTFTLPEVSGEFPPLG